VSKKQIVPRNRPKGFLIEGLAPSTVYDVAIEGVNAKEANKRTGLVRTIAAHPSSVRIVALSCDRPERLLDGETNMWTKLAEQVNANEVDVVLHLGDQVYGEKEFKDAQALLRYSGFPRGAESVESEKPDIKRLHKTIKDRMRDIYRYTWNLPGTATVLSHCSNLMIWSDNDIYNDFTIAKEEAGEDRYL
jgi:phosphodiesterase/alkaline phosphatase D-like protein